MQMSPMQSRAHERGEDDAIVGGVGFFASLWQSGR
jgi:hypothetical protein